MESVGTMTKEESIGLAEKLSGIYSELEQKKRDIRDLKDTIAKIPDHKNDRKPKMFSYYWKYLIIAPVAEVVVFFICLFLWVILMHSNIGGIAFVVFAFLCIITMPAVLFYGGVKASNAVGEANSLLATAAQADLKKKKACTAELEIKETELAECMQKSSEYDVLVPMNMRQKAWMEKVKKTIEAGQAENFTEAIELLGKKGKAE